MVNDLLLHLKETVDQEADFMKVLMETMGAMDTLFAASEQLETTDINESEFKPSSAAVQLDVS